ncbi:MAG: endonuclease domain-containing protein [Deltaproteobacteria bacterium]|nr:endonuclease domain-containing protein [Deltaproteobacteria bacterium]MBN2671111.1 endonuclease domain-containing protein [Deltaproteobacteria bacterium]
MERGTGPHSPPLRVRERGSGGEAAWRKIRLEKRLLLDLARKMRRAPTKWEDIFWQAVRNRKLCGVKFRRQQVIHHFIVDFFVPSHRLVVEIDGKSHLDRVEYDNAREIFLEACGFRVLRFTNEEIEQDLYGVLDAVKRHLSAVTPHL